MSKYSQKISPNFSELNSKEEKNKNIAQLIEIFEKRNLESVNIAEFCGSCGIIVLITEITLFIEWQIFLLLIPFKE